MYKILHLESTDVCNLACPACAREVDPAFRKDSKHHLTVEQIHNHISESEIAQLDKMFMCGNYGDPLLNNNLLDMVKYTVETKQNIEIRIHTNGSLRNKAWWIDLAKSLPSNHRVIFGIDGLEDTHSIYRIGTDFNKIIENAKAFIEAGGRAKSDTIMFAHNEARIDELKDYLLSIGYTFPEGFTGFDAVYQEDDPQETLDL